MLDEYHDLSSKAAYFFTQDLMKYAFHLSFSLVVGVTHGAAAALSDLPLLAAALALSLSFLLFFLLKLLFKITHKSKIKDSRTELIETKKKSKLLSNSLSLLFSPIKSTRKASFYFDPPFFVGE